MSIDFDFIQTEIPIVLTGCLPYILYIYSFRSFVLGYQTDRSLVRLFRDKHLTFLTRAHNRVMDLARLPPTAILQSLVARCRNVYFNVFTVFILYVHNLFLSCLEHQYFLQMLISYVIWLYFHSWFFAVERIAVKIGLMIK